MTDTGIGASVRRKEDNRFLAGKGRYTDDIKRTEQAYACFLRSPYAHAKINGIDTDAAKNAPGVIAVLTGADVAVRLALDSGRILWVRFSSENNPFRTCGFQGSSYEVL